MGLLIKHIYMCPHNIHTQERVAQKYRNYDSHRCREDCSNTIRFEYEFRSALFCTECFKMIMKFLKE